MSGSVMLLNSNSKSKSKAGVSSLVYPPIGDYAGKIYGHQGVSMESLPANISIGDKRHKHRHTETTQPRTTVIARRPQLKSVDFVEKAGAKHHNPFLEPYGDQR